MTLTSSLPKCSRSFSVKVVLPLPVPPAMPMMMVFISCCSLYIQFDLAPGGLVSPAHNAGHLEHAAAGHTGVGVVIFV